jgi:hypothetical protein
LLVGNKQWAPNGKAPELERSIADGARRAPTVYFFVHLETPILPFAP